MSTLKSNMNDNTSLRRLRRHRIDVMKQEQLSKLKHFGRSETMSPQKVEITFGLLLSNYMLAPKTISSTPTGSRTTMSLAPSVSVSSFASLVTEEGNTKRCCKIRPRTLFKSESKKVTSQSARYLALLLGQVRCLLFASSLAFVVFLYSALPIKAFVALWFGSLIAMLFFKVLIQFVQTYIKEQWVLVQKKGLVAYAPESIRPLMDPCHGRSLHEVLSPRTR